MSRTTFSFALAAGVVLTSASAHAQSVGEKPFYPQRAAAPAQASAQAAVVQPGSRPAAHSTVRTTSPRADATRAQQPRQAMARWLAGPSNHQGRPIIPGV